MRKKPRPSKQEKQMSALMKRIEKKEREIEKRQREIEQKEKDELKYKVVENLVEQINRLKNDQFKIDNQKIKEVLTINGIRFSFEDGSWGLIRASSNKPSLVVVTESTSSDQGKKKIFEFIDSLLQKTGKIGKYDQKI